MNWFISPQAGQVYNACACLVGFTYSQLAYKRLHPSHRKGLLYHLMNSTLLMWYFIINVMVATGVLHVRLETLAYFFRFAFAPLIISYVLRQRAMMRAVIRV